MVSLWVFLLDPNVSQPVSVKRELMEAPSVSQSVSVKRELMEANLVAPETILAASFLDFIEII